MKIRRARRLLAVFLTLALMFGLLPAVLAAGEGEAPKLKVTIVSAADGRSTGLRDSELLTVKVEGYDGDLSQLQIHWRNSTTGRMCIYDSPDLSVANYQESVNGNQNPGGTGWWYASVNFPKGEAKRGGWITVSLFDAAGKALGTVKGENEGYYGIRRDGSGTAFAPPSLKDDLSQGTTGMFEGEKLPLSTLLGRMGITHAVCSECTFENVFIQATVGAEVTPIDGGDYLITATHPGEQRLVFTMKKSGQCAFHPGQTAQGVVLLQVFPKVRVTAAGSSVTLDMTNMEDQYTFTLGSQSYTLDGKVNPAGQVTFTDLESNTAYTVEVSVPTSDGRDTIVGYLHVSTPLTYKTAFNCLLDWDDPKPVEEILGGGAEGLFLKNPLTNKIFEVEFNSTNKWYPINLEAGTYDVYTDSLANHRLHGIEVVLPDDNVFGAYINYFSCTTVVNGAEASKTVHWYKDPVTAPAAPTTGIPDGQRFAGWKYVKHDKYSMQTDMTDGAVFQPGKVMTLHVASRLELVALFEPEEYVTATATVTLEHGDDPNAAADNGVTLKLWRLDGDEEHGELVATETVAADATKYDSVTKTSTHTVSFDHLPKLPSTSVYKLTVEDKPSYDITVDTGVLDNGTGNWTFTARLDYNPANFNLRFKVDGQEAKEVVDAVRVQVSRDGDPLNTVSVKLDENGRASGTCPVAKLNGDTPYHYSIQVTAYRLKDGQVVTVADGYDPYTVTYPNNDGWWDEDMGAQQGTPTATLTAKTRGIHVNVTAHHDMANYSAGESTKLEVCTVLLQRQLGVKDGKPIWTTVERKNLDLTDHPADNTGTGGYTFDPVSANNGAGDHTYRIQVIAQNYDEAPQYSDAHNVPIADGTVPADNEVNIDLNLHPETFKLHYTVDASAIDEGYRPSDRTAYVGYSITGGPPWTVISQHQTTGEAIRFGNGDETVTGSLDAWQVHTSGKATRYQISLTRQGDTLSMRESADQRGYLVQYGAPAYYISGAAEEDMPSLKVTLTPKKFTILLEPNAGEETVTGLEDYKGQDADHYQLNHTWSFETALPTGLTREGHVFKGWRDQHSRDYAAGDKLPAGTCEDLTLRAVWDDTPADTPVDPDPGKDDPDPTPTNPTTSTSHVSSKLETGDHMAYIVGYPDGTVQPQANITRAEVAMIFYRLLTPEYRRQVWTMENPYSDVLETDWYGCAAATLTKAGIFKGLPDGSFGGDKPISRAELAAVAVRFLDQKPDGTGKFADISGTWAESEISQTATLGWFNGYPDGLFHPERLITRAEAVTMINRMLGRDKFTGNPFLDGMKTFPDNTAGQWHYEAIQEAANSHAYNKNSRGEERWKALENQ